MKKVLLFIITICTFGLLGLANVHAEEAQTEPTREMRAAWVATVSYIDMAKTDYQSEAKFKQKYLSILDTLEEYNMNTVLFQIRPMNDAFYESELNPWSAYASPSGIQGANPGWDMLGWMIEVTHERGMEYHAWLNPYRVSNNGLSKEALLRSLHEKNFAKKNPDLLMFDSSNNAILNPGEPAVKEFIIDTVQELVEKYDVDAIHFDDYFYPSGISTAVDEDLYNQYKKDGESLADWRRRNVDDVIVGIHEMLEDHNTTNNKAVQFGISPSGIWANDNVHPEGSATRGMSHYSQLYSDTRKWVHEEWIDYIVPQIYWEIGFSVADYEILAHWWADVVKDTDVNLYIGHGLYRYAGNSSWTKDEILNQLELNASIPEIKGSFFYSYKHLYQYFSTTLTTALEELKSDYWNTKVLLPTLNLVPQYTSQKVQNLSATASAEDSVTVSWDAVANNKHYVVYRFLKGDSEVLTNENIYAIIGGNPNSSSVEFVDSDVDLDEEYVYHITSVSLSGEVSQSVTFEYTHQAPADNPDDGDSSEGTTTEQPTEETTNTTEDKNEKDEKDNGFLVPVIVIGAGVFVVVSSIVLYSIKKRKDA